MKMINRSWLVAICASALFHVAGCASGPDEQDPALTPDQVASLPSADDPDHADLAALLAAEVPEDDGETFATPEAQVTVDEPVVDNDDETDQSAPLAVDSQPLLHAGLHPRASRAFRAIGLPAWRIIQTIGNAPASGGTHLQDGTVNGLPYCAATDISVTGLSDASIRNLLERLGRVGFAAWYRDPGHDGWPIGDVRHIHAVFANAKMKTSLQSQIRSWLVGRNGLISNTLYGFYHWSATAKSTVRQKFAKSDFGTTNFGSDCFVGGFYCGGDKISGNRDTLYRCTGNGAPAVVRHCANACVVNAGTDDSCR